MAYDVKFLRGTAANYTALTTKDAKTFYYTTDDNQLYVGAVKLSNAGDITTAVNALKGEGWTADMTLAALNTAIDNITKSGGTIDTKISTALADYYTKTEVDSAIAAAKPTYHDLTAKPDEPLSSDYKEGDVVIVKTVPYEGATIAYYTAYHVIKDGTDLKLAAMDGNYSAENVYFNADLTYTKAIGELPAVPSSGSATLAAQGKNVKQVLDTILAKEDTNPSVTQPATSISGYQSSEDLEVGSNVSKSGTLTSSLSAGSYKYGPATGITATAWEAEVKYTAGKSGSIATGTTASTGYSYSFQMGTDGDTISVNFKATATHGDGAFAKTNLGNTTSIKIAAGTKSKDVTATYTSYRKMFYGTFANKDTMTSATIRTLTGIKQQAKSGNSLDVSVPVGALRVAIAVPAGRSVTSIKDRNGLGAEIFSSFGTETVAVEGANGYTAANYTVYYLDYANPNDKANHYDVTVV